jgi:hypothetical protein
MDKKSFKKLFRKLEFKASDLNTDAGLSHLKLTQNKKLIKLEELDLIEDEAHACHAPQHFTFSDFEGDAWKVGLKKGVMIKKHLFLDDERTQFARLIFKAIERDKNTHPLWISINGTKLKHLPFHIAYPKSGHMYWYYLDLPKRVLKKGLNEIFMWTESDSPAWSIFISPLERSQHSWKSLDAGKTWNSSRLSNDEKLNGEFAIRFSLDRYSPSGHFLSPIMDSVQTDEILKHSLCSLRSKFTFDVDIPKDTQLHISIRFSASPLSHSMNSEEWKEVNLEKGIQSVEKRFFQWKAEFSTSNPLKSPAIKGLHIVSEGTYTSSETLSVKEVQNGRIIQLSYPYTYEYFDHPELKKFRTKFKLDQIVEGSKSEFEKMLRLLRWAYEVPVQQFPTSWNPNEYILANDLEFVPNPKKRRRDAHCMISNNVLITALLSMGFQARHTHISTESTGGHEIMEAWSNDFNKWFHMDATRDFYYYDPQTGIPLSIFEVHDLVAEVTPAPTKSQGPYLLKDWKKGLEEISIGIYQGKGPVPLTKEDAQWILRINYFWLMPRNNLFSEPTPLPPPKIVQSSWGWNGFLSFYDEKFPPRYEYANQTSRSEDFYQPLNQCKVYLFETKDSDTLQVLTETFTPGFSTFLVNINESGWREEKPLWLWRLNPGLNRLEVRSRNGHNVAGPISKIEIIFN